MVVYVCMLGVCGNLDLGNLPVACEQHATSTSAQERCALTIIVGCKVKSAAAAAAAAASALVCGVSDGCAMLC